MKELLYRFICRIIPVYRVCLRWVFRCPNRGVLPPGRLCAVEDPTEGETHGDIVHPCVRYENKGGSGRWWMVYTPFYRNDSQLENPRLCFADEKDGDAPFVWHFDRFIKERPISGYNSDPTLLIDNGKKYVFWRENYTPLSNHFDCSRITIGCEVQDESCRYFSSPQLFNAPRHQDREVCPTFLPVSEGYRAYAMDIRFCSPNKYTRPDWQSRLLARLSSLANVLFFYDSQKCFGVSLWDSPTLEGPFSYSKTVRFTGVHPLFHPWHMDLFETEGLLYAVVQTNKNNGDVYLAYSKDRESFRFFKKPLVTSRDAGGGIYKPSALVVNGVFYLFYTRKESAHSPLNQMFVSSINWGCLLKQQK